MDKVEITFLPQGKSICAQKGQSLLDVAREAFIDIESSCNGKGTCGKCRVQHIEGHIDKPHIDEIKHIDESELSAGTRLACRSKVSNNASFKVLADSCRKHRILSDGFMPGFELNPNIKKVYVELAKPTLEDNIDDVKMLERAMKGFSLDNLSLAVLQQISNTLRENDFKVTLIFSGNHLIGIEPGDTTGACFGIAVDIGTTTVVASMVDLNTGSELSVSSMINPQKSYGLDVLTRIQYIREHPDGLRVLSNLIREGIDSLIGDICGQSGIDWKNIYEITIAANATMMHLFLEVNPSSIGSFPYVSSFTSSLSIPAGELGLRISSFGTVYCLPSVSSYIGADIVAGLLTAEIDKLDEKALFIDIGTNGEIVFGSKDGLYACSCAAGPALEGMNISCGVRAAEGAIEKVYIDDDISIHTIGNKKPVGICGSGIIDTVAELIKVGAVTKSGRFAKLNGNGNGNGKSIAWHSKLINDNGSSRFILDNGNRANGEVSITQKDIRQVQLAKGAILSGMLALINQLKIGLSDIDRVYVAGAFGHHVRMDSLARLGVLPEECLDRVSLIGNSSKAGALLCLLSVEKRQEASEIAKQVEYIELSCYPDYDRLFADCLSF